MDGKTSKRMQTVLEQVGGFMHFFTESFYTRYAKDPQVCDFAFGNPQEMPLAGFTQTLQSWAVPQDKDWYAYKMNEDDAVQVVAAALRQRDGLAYDEQDIFMTTGGFGAIAVSLNALLDPGDEVVFISPPWFFYEAMISAYGGVPVRVKIDPLTFNLDLPAIQKALTPRTRAVLINSPNNPTGKIYPPETLKALAQMLTEHSQRYGHTIYLLSDEAYSRIVYDGREFHSPMRDYPATFMLYTYGKTLLTPGQRLGYIALSPRMPDRESLRQAIFASQLVTAYAFPNALLQHALPDLQKLSIDIQHLQKKRDRMVAALREMGYQLHIPEGTFYLLVRAPIADDLAFCELLGKNKVLCLPGTIVEMPGYFRISLTANDDMITRALSGFAQAYKEAIGEAVYN